MLHVPLTLDVSSQWWEIVLQWLAHLHILASCYQTYGFVSPVQSCSNLHRKHPPLLKIKLKKAVLY